LKAQPGVERCAVGSAVWDAEAKTWELRYGAVVELGLRGRIVERAEVYTGR